MNYRAVEWFLAGYVVVFLLIVGGAVGVGLMALTFAIGWYAVPLPLVGGSTLVCATAAVHRALFQ
jgi:hypothetical protein